MLVLSLLFNLLIVNHCSMLQLNRKNSARLDVVARDFWGRNRQIEFFDIRVFNPFAHSYPHSTLSRCYVVNEQEKCCAYDERIHKVERACFSPLVFSASGGMGPSATTVYSKLASMLSDEWDQPYSRCMFWLCCWLCFSLLRSAIMCIKDHRSMGHGPIPSNIDLAYSEGCLTSVALD